MLNKYRFRNKSSIAQRQSVWLLTIKLLVRDQLEELLVQFFGDDRIRTDNFMLAKHTLYQLELHPLLLLKIPQFDILSIGAQIFGLLTTLLFYYILNIKLTIPMFIEVKKFRLKKLKKSKGQLNAIKNFISSKSKKTYSFLIKTLSF